ncbi:efflux RND transporter periplasmic adaptor subunit [Moritella marina ATCC 15381]|uniref:Efflux RND transporter periplasmic adaptor subunit n=1 Tax=Moritella marina ATCC 15381 TaxID=1202962 RepID=A0A5J6WNZ5_MORMI|nr:efflux RND transporter periplasmic adaptor subunit [Moritella marina]QFI39889.1 efflux RND transporter periplasmic adaptor subunit [Moritella marina ATCC 15381]
MHKLSQYITLLLLSITAYNATADTAIQPSNHLPMNNVQLADNYVTGQLVAARSVIISSENSGIVDEFNKDIGDKVQAGETLAKLSIADNVLNVELAQAELAVSLNELKIQQKQLQRYQALYNKNGISASEFDEQRRKTNTNKAQVEVDKIKLAMAKREQDKSQISAPFSGVILTRDLELGQFIPAGLSLYTLVDMDKVKVRFYLLELDVVSVNVGDAVTVTIPALKNKQLTGHIQILAPAFQTNEPGFLVEVLLDNSKHDLKPGMQARVQFIELGA